MGLNQRIQLCPGPTSLYPVSNVFMGCRDWDDTQRLRLPCQRTLDLRNPGLACLVVVGPDNHIGAC